MTTPIKLSPLNGTAQKLGARWTEIAGWRCVQDYGNPAAEAAALRAAAGLTDISQIGKIQIEGAQAGAMLAAALGAAPQAVGADPQQVVGADPQQAVGADPQQAVGGHVRVSAGDLYCLRPDMYFLCVPTGTEALVTASLGAAAASQPELVTITDVTHGLAGIELVGPRTLDVMTRVCGLDFSDAAFPDQSARQSSVAKTRQLIIRHDRGTLPTYTLLGARSLAAYIWSVLLEAGRPFGLTPVGLEALRTLEAA